MYTVGKSYGTSSRLLCQCTCQGHSSITVNTCVFAELMLATAQVNAESNGLTLAMLRGLRAGRMAKMACIVNVECCRKGVHEHK